jgi:hypothetical protein
MPVLLVVCVHFPLTMLSAVICFPARKFTARAFSWCAVGSRLITNQLRTLQTSVSGGRSIVSAPGVKGGETISGGCVYIINQLGPKPRKLQSRRGYLHARQCFGGAAAAAAGVVSGATRAAIDPPLGRHWMCAKNMLVYSENFNISFYYLANKLKRRARQRVCGRFV